MSEAKPTPGPWIVCVQDGDGAAHTVFAESQLVDERIQAGAWDWKIASAGLNHENCEANARLIAAAPELLDAHEPDREGPGFLEWVADRLVIVHGEHEGSDFILCLRRRAALARAAIAKASGTP